MSERITLFIVSHKYWPQSRASTMWLVYWLYFTSSSRCHSGYVIDKRPTGPRTFLNCNKRKKNTPPFSGHSEVCFSLISYVSATTVKTLHSCQRISGLQIALTRKRGCRSRSLCCAVLSPLTRQPRTCPFANSQPRYQKQSSIDVQVKVAPTQIFSFESRCTFVNVNESDMIQGSPKRTWQRRWATRHVI